MENSAGPVSANDRFKRNGQGTSALGLLLAVAAHVAAFTIFPELEARAVASASPDLVAVELPPAIDIPPPPEAIVRPAEPRIATVQVDPDLTIAPTTFDQNPVRELGPPPAESTIDDARPGFIPYDVAPRLLNRAEVLAALSRAYPQRLQNAGISRQVVLWLYIDEGGKVTRTQVQTSSGIRALDDAAVRVAESMCFSPAKNRDKVTSVWITQPIDFSVVG